MASKGEEFNLGPVMRLDCSELLCSKVLLQYKRDRESEREECKSWLKTQHSKNEDSGIQSHHLMANRWRNNGNSERPYFGGGSKITADGDCNHEI